MKKTLFLTMMAAAMVAPVHATVDGVRVDPGAGVYISSELTVDSSNVDDYLQPGTFGDAGPSAGVVVGTSHGAGSLTVVGVDVSTPNNLYISGNGGGGQADSSAIDGVMNPGTVILQDKAKLTVSGSNADWNGMQLQVGTSSTASHGTLRVEGGSTVDAGPRMYVGGGASTGEVVITGAKSSVQISGQRVVTGALGNVHLTVGVDAGSTGIVTVENKASLSIKNNGIFSGEPNHVIIGDEGVGTLNVTGAGTAFSSTAIQFVIGHTADSKGTVNVSDDARFSSVCSRVFYVGYEGEGELNISGTENFSSSGGFYVGLKNGSSGSVNLDGQSAAKFNLNGPAYIGYEGTAELNISGNSTVTFSGAEVDVACTSDGKGSISVSDHSRLALTTDSLFLGNKAGAEAHLAVDSTSQVSIFGILSSGYTAEGNYTIDNAGVITAGRGMTLRHGTVVTNTGTFENTSNAFNITVMEGSTFRNTETAVIRSADGMRVDIGSQMTNHGAITSEGNGFKVGDSSTLINTGTISTESALVILDGASVDNSGDITIQKSAYEADFYGLMVAEGAELTNSGSITADTLMAVEAGSTLHNTGSIILHKTEAEAASYGFYIGENANIFTGKVSVKGRANELSGTGWSELTSDQISYDTGIYFADEGGGFADRSNGTKVTLGALIEGEDTLQYLYKKDWQAIQNSIAAALGAGEADVAYANEIGKNISAHFTTDDVSGNGESYVVAIGEGTVVVDRGIVMEGSIGSYNADINESAADIRVDEKVEGSTVHWGGSTLKTVDTDKETILRTHDTVDLTYVDGTETSSGILVVVKDTTLRSAGTVLGGVRVEQDGKLVVGNSPGCTTFGEAEISGAVAFCVAGVDEAATAIKNGWDSGTYSQLILNDGTGTLAFTNTATIHIELGGASLVPVWSDPAMSFDLTLVTGITTLIVGDETFTSTGLSEYAVSMLKGMTTFSITDEEGGHMSFASAYTGDVEPAEFTYSLVSNGRGTYDLHLKGYKTVPEPTTATLSLLALAALCARRRRKAN